VIVERAYAENVGAVECHVAALAEALYQVAKNAVESMPRGGTVRASVRREGDRVVLAVADEGKGIPPERLAKVFDPFYARETNDTFTRGRVLAGVSGHAGLGLSAVYGIVAAMGGKVEIESQVDRGTTVSIVLQAKH
jgi:signal transduction histidine kinase